MKMNEWFRKKAREFLGISDFENKVIKYMGANNVDIDDLHNEIDMNDHKLNQKLNFEIDGQDARIEVLHNTIENVVHIGTDVDVHQREHSWAVICIEGKTNIVKFVSLNRDNMMDIMRFLKQFEAGRHCIDTPYKQMFEDGLFKFE